ncbi:hypothetical protein ANRL4_03709 [Anaerolineae bacterium]|nr:hypothetical protein ANRL4_03709 [Anaerolineae bacterium]
MEVIMARESTALWLKYIIKVSITQSVATIPEC